MKKILKIISLVLLIGIVGVSIFTLVGCEDFKKKVDETVDEVKDAVNDLEFNVVEECGINLAIAPMNASSTDEYEAKTITATATKFDGTVATPTFTWHVEWLESPTEGAVVTDYVTVECETDDTSVATVKCYKGFASGKILLVCSIEPEGVSATCLISYGGIPEWVELDFGFHMEEYYPGKQEILVNGQDFYEAASNDDVWLFEIGVGLDNAAGKLGVEYLGSTNYTVAVTYAEGAYSLKEFTVENGEIVNEEIVRRDFATDYFNFFRFTYDETDEVILIEVSSPMAYVDGDTDTKNGTYSVFHEFLGLNDRELDYGAEVTIEVINLDFNISTEFTFIFDFSTLVGQVSLNQQEMIFTK